MAKQKRKAVWGWVQTKQSFKPTEAQKAAITARFEPLVQQLKQDLRPVEEPQTRNQCVDVFTKWWRAYFYVMQKFQCPPEGYTATGFELGTARFEFRGADSFDLAYFRHTGQWGVIAEGQGLEECLKAVGKDPWFQVF